MFGGGNGTGGSADFSVTAGDSAGAPGGSGDRAGSVGAPSGARGGVVCFALGGGAVCGGPQATTESKAATAAVKVSRAAERRPGRIEVSRGKATLL